MLFFSFSVLDIMTTQKYTNANINTPTQSIKLIQQPNTIM